MSHWMQTYTGKRFHPLEPDPADVDPRDVAHSLALICRYGGHSLRFYSVAEHCVLMSRAVAPEHALAALLHDATEAYVGDMVRPLKLEPAMEPYRRAEGGVWLAVCARFGIRVDLPAEVHEADNRIIVDERAAVMALTDDDWALAGKEELGVVVEGWSPRRAEHEYLERLAELGVSL